MRNWFAMSSAKTPALLLPIALAAWACGSPHYAPADTSEIAGEYSGSIRGGIGAGPVPISISLKRDGTFVGAIPTQPMPDSSGYKRAIGTWEAVRIDVRERCAVIAFKIEGVPIADTCVSRGPQGDIGINCTELSNQRRQCDMTRARQR